jgi:hypothetical protein
MVPYGHSRILSGGIVTVIDATPQGLITFNRGAQERDLFVIEELAYDDVAIAFIVGALFSSQN